MYDITMSVKNADYHFERSASHIFIGKSETAYRYKIKHGELTIYSAPNECLDAVMSLGIQRLSWYAIANPVTQ